MRYLKKAAFLFALGSTLYCLFEILYRGYTHWTMAITGGLCCMGLSAIDTRLRRLNLLVRALLGAALITAMEFSVGCLVNRVLHWNVWDYSQRKFHLLGQICLRASSFWYALSLIFMGLSAALGSKLRLFSRT